MVETTRARPRRIVRMATLALASVLVAVAAWAVACSDGTNATPSDSGAPASTTTGTGTGSMLDAGTPPSSGNDAGPPSTSDDASSSPVLIVAPAGSTLDVSGPGATLQFTATPKGASAAVTASWTVSQPLVGNIDSNGLFTASGQLGGLVTISAQTATAHGATTLTVDLSVAENAADAGANVVGALRDGGSADPAFTWLYPYDKTVFPRGLASPTLQWGGEAATYTRIHMKSTTIDYEAFFAGSNPPRVALSAADWSTVTESAAPGDPLTIEATKMSASGVTGPVTETWTIAQGTLKGSVYYNTYDSPLNDGNGAVMRLRPGSDAQILLGGCHVCHTVSANGSTIVAMGAQNDPKPDAGYTGSDPYFYKLGASYDLTDDAGLLHAEDDPQFAFAALTPDGTRLLSCGSLPGFFPPNIPGLGGVGSTDGGTGDRASRLQDPRDGGFLAAPGFDGVVSHALMPAFSPDGTKIVFNHYDQGGGKSLAVMSFAETSDTFSGLTDIVAAPDAGSADAGADAGDAGAPYLAWPYFLPDSKTVVYNTVNYPDYATWNDYGNEPNHYGDLFLVDSTTNVVTSLDALNGLASGAIYLPYGAAEAHLNYEPTVLPVAVGGYYWVVFTSRREYGNTITNASDPGHATDAGPFETHPATRKKLWVAALDLNLVPGKDPSHPAFYLDGQEALAGNMRGFWALDPCAKNGGTCGSGDECCSGFCRQSGTDDGGAVLTCVAQPTGCSQEFEKCATAGDCCGVAQGYQCLNGFCAQP
jgi:hypothetical protein